MKSIQMTVDYPKTWMKLYANKYAFTTGLIFLFVFPLVTAIIQHSTTLSENKKLLKRKNNKNNKINFKTKQISQSSYE
jgi:hypothetical protein